MTNSLNVFHELCGHRRESRRIALIDPERDGGRNVSYDELRADVERRVSELALRDRSVVLLAGPNCFEYVVSYLALLSAGHIPLLTGDRQDRLIEAWSPAAVVRVGGGAVEIERRGVDPVELHPDLALLLSTSGSTGSPKLVRLSSSNLVSNAAAIASYLGLDAHDRGITSLPLHYCYGLSVLHSHLIAGASVVLTDRSVVDAEFASSLARFGVTNVAGVPHTFDLIEQAGSELLHVPSMRFLTQAGGRLGEVSVKRWLDRASTWGVEFYVMYGQTEATARMAYLPPSVAARRPTAIGVPIPGGELTLRPVDGIPADVGELIFRGPNVMMGYATVAGDLAEGAGLDELRTGDLGRFHADDGVFEIVGRLSRFVKPFGLRIDLDRIESELDPVAPNSIAVAGDDERLVIVAPGADAQRVAEAARALTGLPNARIVIDVAIPIPRTATDKVDYDGMLRRLTDDRDRQEAATDRELAPAVRTLPASVAAVYAAVLDRDVITPSDSFISLGGDSLSYIECSARLEAVLGSVPPDWHRRPIEQFEVVARPRRLARIDITVLLRALAISVLVGTHMRVWFVLGGAHLLVALVGYNVGRFTLAIDSARQRLTGGLKTAARAAGPTMAWVAGNMAITGAYGIGTLLLINNYVGPKSHRDGQWHFWFIEVFVHLIVLTTAALTIPAVRQLERRYPYGFPFVLLLTSLTFRMEWAHLGDWYNLRYRTHGVAWLFVLGWLIERSNSPSRRVLTTVMCLATVPGFFRDAEREWFIVIGLCILLWWREVPFPRVLVRPVAVVAAASMWIYITHFTFWPLTLEYLDRELAYICTLVIGIVAWAVAARAHGWWLVLARLRHLTSERAPVLTPAGPRP